MLQTKQSYLFFSPGIIETENPYWINECVDRNPKRRVSVMDGFFYSLTDKKVTIPFFQNIHDGRRTLNIDTEKKEKESYRERGRERGCFRVP